MSGATKRLARIFVTYSIKILSLLLAVSVISFILVTASPVDPVQQYILGLGTAVSPEQAAIGIILSESMRYLSTGMWWTAVLPGLTLVLIVLLVDKLGDYLRMIIDPYSAQE